MLRTFLFAVLLAVLSLALIAGCWKAGFTNYDDTQHVTDNPRLAKPVFELLKPTAGSTYFPVTLLSYRLDKTMFAGWMPHTGLGSWAPGVRAMTLLYHIGAALFLWRMLLRLRLSTGQACFIALVFAVHPLACETVCWISERKNALAGLFGFAALWAFLAGQGRWWRVPLAFAIYALALGSKPSALGLLPVFVLLELFGGAAGLDGAEPLRWRNRQFWGAIAARLAPLALIAGLALVFNLRGHAVTVVPPPGGTIFTALLTDLEILARYLGMLLAPFSLSAAYFVDPVRSLWDLRVACYALLLAALLGSTVAISANRRRAVFGWLWFLGALGPNLNLIALPHLMQDRYIYLSTPGFFLVVAEAVEGLRARLAALNGERGARVFRWAGSGYIALLVALAFARGAVWQSMLTVFSDAVNKQPQSVFAHYGLGAAYAQVWEDNRDNPRANRERLKTCRQLWLQEWKTGIDRCPDYPRFVCYQVMALNVGDEFNRLAGEEVEGTARQKKLQAAEHYWQVAATRSPESGYDAGVRAAALVNLATLGLSRKQLDEAYRLACDAVAACDEPSTRLARACAAVSLARSLPRNSGGARAQQLIAQAREDASSVPAGSELHADAQTLLHDPIFEQQ